LNDVNPVPPLAIPIVPVRPWVSVEEMVIFLLVVSVEIETLDPAANVKVSLF
jgi:hypothetical protein